MADHTAENDQPAQVARSQRALDVKTAGETDPPHPAAEDTPSDGMRLNEQPDQPPSGAFDAEGQRPVLERSRKVR